MLAKITNITHHSTTQRCSIPFVSQKQRALFYAMEDREEISEETMKRWKDETPEGKKLPERVKKSFYEQGRMRALRLLNITQGESQ